MKKLFSLLLMFTCTGFTVIAQVRDDTTLVVAENQEAEVAYNKGIENYKNKLYQEAINNFTEAISYKVDFAKAYFNRGSVKAELKMLQDAITDFDATLKYDSTMLNAIIHVAR